MLCKTKLANSLSINFFWTHNAYERCFARLGTFVQLKKREKHPRRKLKVTLIRGCFSRFLNCANDTKLCNAIYITKSKKRVSPFQCSDRKVQNIFRVSVQITISFSLNGATKRSFFLSSSPIKNVLTINHKGPPQILDGQCWPSSPVGCLLHSFFAIVLLSEI